MDGNGALEGRGAVKGRENGYRSHVRCQKNVNLRAFKEFVQAAFQPETPLYQVIMAERDEVSVEEYLSKFLTWLKLINLSLQPVTRRDPER